MDLKIIKDLGSCLNAFKQLLKGSGASLWFLKWLRVLLQFWKELPGSKYEYWKVLGQKAIFEEDQCQNMILGIFGIKTWFWEFMN